MFYYISGSFNPENGDEVKRLGNYNLNGKEYQDAYIVEPKSPTYLKKIYFAKKYGIIRKELVNGKIYNLSFTDAKP